MHNAAAYIAKIAVPLPLRQQFDYLLPKKYNPQHLHPGMRIMVPFGSRKLTGILLSIEQKSELPKAQLKYIYTVLDEKPLFSAQHLALLQWASQYYHAPLGEVILGSLPKQLRIGNPAMLKIPPAWSLSEMGQLYNIEQLKRAPQQQALLKLFKAHPNMTLAAPQLKTITPNWHAPLQKLQTKGLVKPCSLQQLIQDPAIDVPAIPSLNDAQQQACQKITAALHHYQAFLLNGVTGSGKTEVYMRSIQTVIQQGKQALLLLPEINLTPQMIQHFTARFSCSISVLHSALTDKERLTAWLAARDGTASIIIGTRSAIWTPLAKAGIYIIDEEHDLAYKQQDRFRYFARDIALVRAKKDNVPVVLGSATPSLESLYNTNSGRYQSLPLPQRAGNASMPKIQLLDIRNTPMQGALSQPLIERIADNLKQHRQTILFLNRRGYANILLCHHCGWRAQCTHCELPLVIHKKTNMLDCHHCGYQKKIIKQCPDCHTQELLNIGHGTERIEENLTTIFPAARLIRIDRDTTNRKGTLQNILTRVHKHEADILIGTQMLTKGHHFPEVSLVGIIDVDRGFYSNDFRASERMAQQLIQVSGRAGRQLGASQVILQTHCPEHPLLQVLIKQGYTAFSEQLMRERKEANLPPFSYLILLRVEAHRQTDMHDFLNAARNFFTSKCPIQIFGPFPSPIQLLAGRHRAQLLLQADNRKLLRKIVTPWITFLDGLPQQHKVHWSIDVDPQDMY